MGRPPPLRPGDRVAVVAPSGPFDRTRFDRGLARLAARYAPVLDAHLFDAWRYLAGSDRHRAQGLRRAFEDASLRAVFCARGGSGSARLLRDLPIADWPDKPLVGFSDTTSLHAALQCAGRTSVHGPVVTQLADQPDWVMERLFDVLEGSTPGPLEGGTSLVPGRAEGPLVGGNLVVFQTLLGTRWCPPLAGAVLLLEEVGELPYRIDRAWTHLRNAGVFDQVAGIVLGQFTDCELGTDGTTAADVLRTLAEETGLPCAMNFPIGHGAVNAPVILGGRVRLDAEAGALLALEPATA